MNETKKDGLLFGLEVGNTALPSRSSWSLSTISNLRQRKSWFTLLCWLPRVPLKHGRLGSHIRVLHWVTKPLIFSSGATLLIRGVLVWAVTSHGRR